MQGVTGHGGKFGYWFRNDVKLLRMLNIGSDSISVAALWRHNWRGPGMDERGPCSTSGKKTMVA